MIRYKRNQQMAFNKTQILADMKLASPGSRQSTLTKALDAYLHVTIEEINVGIQYGRKQFNNTGQFSLNRTRIRNAIHKYNTRTKKGGTIYWSQWFEQNYPLVTVIPTPGRGKGSKNKFTSLAKLNISMSEFAQLSKQLYNTQSIQERHIDPYVELVEAGQMCIDWIPVDIHSLQDYIAMTEHNLANLTATELDSAYGRTIYANWMMAQNWLAYIANTNSIPQFYDPNQGLPGDRKYYKGMSLQQTSSQVRTAVLGDCVELDISNMAFTYMLSQIHPDDRRKFELLDYIKNRDAWRTGLAKVLQKNWLDKDGVKRELHSETALKIVKQAIQILAFGGKTHNSYPVTDADGNIYYKNTSLSDIIRNKTARDAFLNHSKIKAIIAEIKDITSFVTDATAETDPELAKQFTNGRGLDRSALLCYLYRVAETGIMNDVKKLVDLVGAKPLLTVHDGMYLDSLTTDQFVRIQDAIGELHGDLYKLTRTEHSAKYKIVDWNEVHEQEAQHAARIKREEQTARDWVAQAADTTQPIDYAKRNQQITIGKILYEEVQRNRLLLADIQNDPESYAAYQTYQADQINRLQQLEVIQ